MKVSPLVAVCLLAMLVPDVTADDLKGGDLELGVDAAGQIRDLKVKHTLVAESIRLFVARPDWQGSVATTSDIRVIEQSHTADSDVLVAVAPGRGDAVLEIRREIECSPDALAFRYVLSPRRDTETAATTVQLSLPLDVYQGRRWFVLDRLDARRGDFPKRLPADYTFLRSADFDALAFQTPGRTDSYWTVRPDWETVSRVQVQDNRKFGLDCFEAQIYASLPATLRKGKRYEFAFTLGCAGQDEIETNWRKAAEARRSLTDSMTCHGPPKLLDIRPNQQQIAACERLELAVRLQAEYSNPFDPDDVALDAHFVPPSGKTHVVPGFLWHGFERKRVGGSERLSPTGEYGWRIRYCPTEAGQYRYWLTLRDGDQEDHSDEASFQVTESQHHGFVRVAKKNPYAFEFDDGSPYFAIGENVCWPGGGGTYDYDNYWAKLSAHGANYARLWIGPFDVFTLERLARNDQEPVGLGRYDAAGSWRIDYVVDSAAKHNLKIMYCIESFNSLRIRPHYARWDECPYNAANGGPIERPEQFFTDETARRLFKRRLRYIVARWSHSPAILSWEFWNEVNIVEHYVSQDVAAWHKEMARYLRELDPHNHLLTTSWAGPEGDPAVDGLPELDYIQSHQYGARDAASMMIDVCHDKRRRYRKPHYFGEFGTDAMARSTRGDVDGIHLHNGLWSGVVSGAAGTAMLWWWDSYVEPFDLYHHFQPVANFVAGIPFNAAEYRPARVGRVTYAGSQPPPRYEDLVLSTQRGSWKPAPHNRPTTFTVGTNGKLDPADRLTHVLHGLRNHPTLHNPATFKVDYDKPGKSIVQIDGVSGHGGARLKVYLDGDQKLEHDFVDDDDSTKTLTGYNRDYAIEVPEGKHEIRVVNDGNDWLFVTYRLSGYRRRTDPGLQAWALVAERAVESAPVAIVWVKNERYNWYNHSRAEVLRAIPPSRIELKNLADGDYEIEWWDTLEGKVTTRAVANSQGDTLWIEVPELSTDAACKIYRRG